LTLALYTAEQRFFIGDFIRKNEGIEEEGKDIEKIIVNLNA
jgi:hypothetical protein